MTGGRLYREETGECRSVRKERTRTGEVLEEDKRGVVGSGRRWGRDV